MWMTLETVTKWGESETEKQISCNIAYMWNLEKWYSKAERDTDVENKCMVMDGGGGGGQDELGGWDWRIYTMYKIDN